MSESSKELEEEAMAFLVDSGGKLPLAR